MTEDTGNPKENRPKHRLVGGIGSGLGVAVGLIICNLIDYKSFWLGLVLVGGCAGIGGFLAQKIASE